MSGQRVFNFDGWIGGTELMAINLEEKIFSINPEFKEWNWILVPGEMNIREDGKNIAYIHLGEYETDLNWICNPLIAHVIFVSYYQYQRFTEMYPQLDHSKCHVLRNAIDPIPLKEKDNSKIKLIFHSEPYRGLDVLLKALSFIDDRNIELHVFGDLNTDTIEWKDEYKNRIKEMCYMDNRVLLHGRVSNNTVRNFIGTCHIFAYPSTWKETSCISLIEAMSAGLYCITNSFTVLPETGSGYTKIYPFNKNLEKQAEVLANEIRKAVKVIRSDNFNPDNQIDHINQIFSWESRKQDWENFLNIIKNPKETSMV